MSKQAKPSAVRDVDDDVGTVNPPVNPPAKTPDLPTSFPSDSLGTIIDFLKGKSSDVRAFVAACAEVVEFGLGQVLDTPLVQGTTMADASPPLSRAETVRATPAAAKLADKLEAAYVQFRHTQDTNEGAAAALGAFPWKTVLKILLDAIAKLAA